MPTSDDDSATVSYGLGAPSASSQAPIHGTNNLQASIDKFDAAVSKLAGLYTQAAGQAGGIKGSGGSGGNNGGIAGLVSAGGGSGSGAGFIGQLTHNFSTGYNQAAASQGPPSGSAGTITGKAAHTAGGFIGQHPGLVQAALGVGMVGSAIAAVGGKSMDNQVQMSGFVQQNLGWLSAGNTGGSTRQQIMNSAFGNNQYATGQADAAGGASIISSMSGRASGYGNAASQAYGGGASSFAYATGQGYTAGAQMAQATFSRTASMNAMMMGLGGASALRMGGGQRTMQQQDVGMMQGIFQGRSKISASAFGTSFNSVTGKGYADLLNFYGGNAQMTASRVQELQQYNKLANAGYDPAQQAAIIAGGQKGNKNDVGIMTSVLGQSDQQRINRLTSTKTSRTADLANGYNAGLTQSVDLLTKFNDALNNFLKLPGVSTLVGFGQGATGTLKNLAHPGDLVGGGAGLIELGRGIGTMFGKGGGPKPTGQGTPPGNSPLVANTNALEALTAAIDGLLGKTGTTAGGNRGTAHAGGRARSRTTKSGRPLGGVISDVFQAAGGILGGAAGALIPGPDLTGVSEVLGGIAGAKAGGWAAGALGFADGGVVGGSDTGRDSKTIKVRGGEGILVPSAVRALGGKKAIDKINRAHGGGKHNQRHHYAQGGTVTGAEIDQYAEQFAGKTPYVWGGDSSSTGWDCSGMAYEVYNHFGLSTGMPRTAAEQWKWVKRTAKPEAGGLAFFSGADGTQASPGHVGIITGPNSMVDAYDTQSGTMNNPISGSSGAISGYGVPPKGFTSSGAGNGTSGNNSTKTSAGGSVATSAAAVSLGLSPGSYGSSNEVNVVSSALAGGGSSLSAGGNAAPSSSSSSSSSSSGGAPAGGATGPGAAAAQSWMKSHMSDYGWNSSQWSPLVDLWNHESGWRWNAQNPSSPAYGIPQADPGSKMASMGSDWKTNDVTQMRWGANYIKETYQNPANAWAFEMSHTPNWYAGGTNNAAGGMAWVGERGPELMNLPAGAKVATNAASKNYAKGTAQTPWSAQLAGIGSGAAAHAGCQGHSVNVTFGDIQIGSDSGGSATTMAQNAREFIRETKRQLEQDTMFTNIAAGVK